MSSLKLGQNIKRLRQAQELSQARGAARAGLDPATWNQVETGARRPNVETLEKIAAALEVEMADLFQEESEVCLPTEKPKKNPEARLAFFRLMHACERKERMGENSGASEDIAILGAAERFYKATKEG